MSQLTLPTARCEAIWVLISSDTWATLTPSRAGSMRVVTRRVPGCAQAWRRVCHDTPMRGSSPRRRSAGTCTPSCRAPPSNTPPAIAVPKDSDIPAATKEALAGKSTRDGYVADVESLKYLLQASDIDLNKPLVAEAELPVHYVAENAYDMLVSLGADPLKTTAEGNTRLMMCLKNAWRDCSDAHFDQLLALSNAKTANLFGNTPLHELCKSNSLTKERPELGQRLIASQDINAVNYAGQTALHYCITQRDKTVANALIAAGADLDIRDGYRAVAAALVADPDVDGCRRRRSGRTVLRSSGSCSRISRRIPPTSPMPSRLPWRWAEGASAHSRQADEIAIRWPARLPLSTAET